ncbi:phosphoglucomutase isoform X1 [Halyomorpha halys]|uniref:phosphoglucomutase isoform X1 n=1 Tax=Halyomorpha halys TaxID=286706 RepID=UPI0006D4C6C7|nr:phosphoglucomutase isoform X1 [Halyomorpha halys]
MATPKRVREGGQAARAGRSPKSVPSMPLVPVKIVERMASSASGVVTVKTTAFEDQQPGTSGLRKPLEVYTRRNYTENFVESILRAVGPDLKGSSLVIGGDGRNHCVLAATIAIKMSAAKKVRKVVVGKDAILSTPAASNMIRNTSSIGGILLTASHNPASDFGIKFNMSNGGAAPTSFTDKVFEISKELTEYSIVPDLNIKLNRIGEFFYKIGNEDFVLQVIDPVKSYVDLMKEIFDFPKLKNLLSDPKEPFKIVIDCMNAVTGPYAKEIFENELCAEEKSVINAVPLGDFGGGHPDPNLEYAKDLVDTMKEGKHDFGAAFDGDGDRNMILGKEAFFVTPSDSLAVLADHIGIIPYFQKNKVTGFGRSMPTAAAIDKVAEALNIPFYETPTGWKFFCNLLDQNKIALCGEESFGTGSNHVREKDGIWAALAWLSVIAQTKKPLSDIVTGHWKKYGRHFYLRCDYEHVDAKAAKEMMAVLEKEITSPQFVGSSLLGKPDICFIVKAADNFQYTDPTDGSVTKNQGLRVMMEDGSRIIYRLSGTGSSGATIRVYIEQYEKNVNRILEDRMKVLKPLVEIAISLAKIKKFTGRDEPTVIT